MAYKAVVFDMGDVLFSWNPQASTKVSAQMLLRSITKCALWNDFERGAIDTKSCYQELGQMFSIAPEEIAATFAQTTGSLQPNESMTGLIRDIKRRKKTSVYMMTNIPRPDFDRLRATEYVWDHFDGIFASGYEGMRKPDLSFYQHVQDKIGYSPERILFIDDKLENVTAARELGWGALECRDVEETCRQVRSLVNLGTAVWINQGVSRCCHAIGHSSSISFASRLLDSCRTKLLSIWRNFT